MDDGTCEFMNFVLLIEEHKDILCKSQIPAIKKKKQEAIDAIIQKWTKISGKMLNQKALLKKVNNIKGRSKSAHDKGNSLTDWQSKMIQLMTGTVDDELSSKPIPQISNDTLGTVALKARAEAFMELFETPETSLLTNQQLHRIVLLQQAKVLAMQTKKLERDMGIDATLNNIAFNFIGWDGSSAVEIIEL